MLDRQKHRIALLQILKAIYQDLTISSSLGFKGGTACVLFYSLPRFSVDLDFDLLATDNQNQLIETLTVILNKYGQIKDFAIKHNTIFFQLSYASGFSSIRIEISTRKSNSKYEVKHYLGVPIFVMKQDDIFANKLLALTGRKRIAGRDIFDIWYFLSQQWNINKEIVLLNTGEPFEQYLEACLAVINKTTSKQIVQDMGDLLDTEQKIWVKEHLLADVKFLLQAL